MSRKSALVLAFLITVFYWGNAQTNSEIDYSPFYLRDSVIQYTEYETLVSGYLEPMIDKNEKDGFFILLRKPKFEKYLDTITVELPKEYQLTERQTIPYSYVYRENYSQPVLSERKLKNPQTLLSMASEEYLIIEGEQIPKAYKEVYFDYHGQLKETLVIEKAKMIEYPRIIINANIKNLNLRENSGEITFIKGTKWSKLRRLSSSHAYYNNYTIIILQEKLEALGYTIEKTGFIDDQTTRVVKQFKKDYNIQSESLDELALKILGYDLLQRIEIRVKE